jgi:hypothetical protein
MHMSDSVAGFYSAPLVSPQIARSTTLKIVRDSTNIRRDQMLTNRMDRIR